MLGLSPKRLNRVVAQLAWTLRQVPGLTRIRITSGDAPVPLPDGRRDFSVQEGDAFAPTVRDASDRLFGVDKGRIVGNRRGSTVPAPGPFGRPGYALRSIAVSVDESRIAEVGGDGGTVFAWTRREHVRRIYEGTDVLRPTYDMFDGLWLVDRTPLGRARPTTAPAARSRRSTCRVSPGATCARSWSAVTARGWWRSWRPPRATG